MTEEYWITILKEEDRLIDNSDRKYRYHCKSLESMSEELTFQERYINTGEDFTILCGIQDFIDLVQNEKLAAGLRRLTDRQRQLMLLVLSRLPKTQEELAGKLELEPSTVSRTLSKAGRTIRRLDVWGGPPLSRPEIREWDQADKFSLALQTGMPLYFYYRFCFRGQQVGGVSRYNYELSRRREAGVSPDETARELGLKPKTVRSAYSRLKRQCVQVGHIPAPKDGSIGARLDPETYVKLQRLVTQHVDS